MSRNVLKYIAIICMTLDHIAWYFIDFTEPSSQIMHFFGRMTAPIMCFFVAEGFHYTGNIKAYVKRLTLFAFISFVPYWLLNHELNMMFTLLFGLLALITIESELKRFLKVLILLCLIGISFYSDWLCFGVLWVIAFHRFRENKLKSMVSFFVIWVVYYGYALYNNTLVMSDAKDIFMYSIYSMGSLVSLFLIMFFYDSCKGTVTKSKNRLIEGETLPKKYYLKRFFGKWVFYIYYPLHLLVIYVVLQIA